MKDSLAQYETTMPTKYHYKTTLSRVGICLVILASLTSSGLPSPLYSIYQAQLNLSNTMINVMFSAYAVGVLMTLLVMMPVSDRVTDRRQLIILSSLLLVLSATLMIFSSNIDTLILGRFISGIATGTLLGSANAALLELHPKRDPKITAILSTLSFTLGSATGPLISGFLKKIDFVATTSSFCVLIGMAIIAIPLVMLTRIPVERAIPNNAQLDNVIPINPLRSLPFIVSALTLVTSWSVGAVFMSSGQLFTSDLALVKDAFIAAALITTFQLSAGFGQVFSKRFNPLTAVTLGTILSAIAQILMCLSALFSYTTFYEIFSLFVGLGYGIAFVGATGIVNTYAPSAQRARFLSAFYVVGYVMGNAVPAILVGMLIDHFNLQISIISFTAWIAIVSVVLIICTRKMRQQPSQ
ncbi:MFS transporter [Vibrio sp.]|nr:MFS transporter [Vibrio sp.]